MMGNRAIFLDKDGTLIEDVPYCADPARMRLKANAAEGLSLLASYGYRFFVVSNQPGVALGRFPETALQPVAQRLRELAAEAGTWLTGFYYCPHLPEGTLPQYAATCMCRKPQPGMLLRAAQDHGIDLSRSWLIGDILDDVEAGRRAGCRTVLVNNGGETEWRVSRLRHPDAVVGDLLEAAHVIIECEVGATAGLSA